MTPAVIGESVTVMCSSNGLPEPSYTIMHKNKTVINQATYMINKVKSSDAGTYKCIATNKLGSDSDSKNLTVGKIRDLDVFSLFIHSVTVGKSPKKWKFCKIPEQLTVITGINASLE